MDAERFARELPDLFDEFPRSEQPRDPRFAEILDRLDGLACANNLALLNLAASLLGPGECYVEIGSFKGASLVAAMLGNEDKEFVAIDSFALAGGSRAQLEANLRSFGLEPPEILEGDVFELLDSGVLEGRRLGACYWDLLHKHEPQLAGLRAARAVSRTRRARDRRRLGLARGRQRARRVLPFPAARAAPRHDRGRPPRAAVVVGGDGRPRLGSSKGSRASGRPASSAPAARRRRSRA